MSNTEERGLNLCINITSGFNITDTLTSDLNNNLLLQYDSASIQIHNENIHCNKGFGQQAWCGLP